MNDDSSSHDSDPELDAGRAAPAAPETDSDVADVARLSDAYRRVRAELSQVIVGQERVIEELMIALFAGGHCLLVGVPGLAKTLTIRTLASTLSLQFSRIQFTPDLMPSDIVGTEVMQEDRASGERLFRFLPGPVFANVLLADEINRTPPKTQAALLEAMQERQVTAGGRRHPLPSPFFVLATQNPIEQEGTYPLPEAQLDRFMFQVQVDYPAEEEELEIVLRTTSDEVATVTPVLDAEEIAALTRLVRRTPAAEHVARYALRLARMTRRGEPGVPDYVEQYVQWGAGPRASQCLMLGAKARAVLDGRHAATCADVRSVAAPALRHRIRTSFSADAEGVTADQIIQRLVEQLPEPDDDPDGGKPQVFRSPNAR